jgi:hypothetical protein
MNEATVKLMIQLTDEQSEGYPVSTESLWFVAEGANYRLKNIPFFIDDLAFDDVISVQTIADQLYQIDGVVERSGNSTVWITIDPDANETAILDEIKALGCMVEGGVLARYFAINVPKDVDISLLYRLFESDAYKDTLGAHVAALGHAEGDGSIH